MIHLQGKTVENDAKCLFCMGKFLEDKRGGIWQNVANVEDVHMINVKKLSAMFLFALSAKEEDFLSSIFNNRSCSIFA